MPNTDHPCIVIPGIKGTGLENIYELPPVTTWSTWEAAVAPPDFDSLALDSNGDVDDAEIVLNRASQLLGVAYDSFVQSLRGRGVPVYVFPYDWRYSMVRSAKKLVNYVLALQKKTLRSLGGSNWDGLFDFACHSMGGLVFRQFLAAWRSVMPRTPFPVKHVVFIATPHLGSVDAVESMIRGETVLFGGQKELRKLARTFPGVYELLPNPGVQNTVVNQNSVALDIFDIHNWQSTVTPDPNDPEDFDVEQAHLTAARGVLNALPDVANPEFGLTGRILVIYGYKPNSTLRTVKVFPEVNGIKNWYDFDDADKPENKGAGDEVVPVESAVLAGVPSLEVRGEDVSVFNLKSHVLSLHALLPSLDEVSSVTSRFFTGVTGAALLPKGTDPTRLHP
jgi:hypothetical protein